MLVVYFAGYMGLRNFCFRPWISFYFWKKDLTACQCDAIVQQRTDVVELWEMLCHVV